MTAAHDYSGPTRDQPESSTSRLSLLDRRPLPAPSPSKRARLLDSPSSSSFSSLAGPSRDSSINLCLQQACGSGTNRIQAGIHRSSVANRVENPPPPLSIEPAAIPQHYIPAGSFLFLCSPPCLPSSPAFDTSPDSTTSSAATLELLSHLQTIGLAHHIRSPLSNDYPQTELIRVYLIPEVGRRTGKRKAVGKRDLQRRGEVLLELLGHLRMVESVWKGEGEGDHLVLKPGLTSDHRSLSEVYSSLPSPSPSLDNLRASPQALAFLNEVLSPTWDGPTGLTPETKLHEYQVRTIQQLLLQELAPSQVVAPSFIPLIDVFGKRYYVSPSTGTITRDPPTFEAPRGGILCEEMGAGKTLQTLALILATLSHLPTPPLSLPPRSLPPRPPNQNGVRTLEELCRHVLRTHPICAAHPLGAKDREEGRRSVGWSILRAKGPTPAWFVGAASGVTAAVKQMALGAGSRKRRNEVALSGDEGAESAIDGGRTSKTKKIWLGWATLVTVPDHLLEQWEKEIAKHAQPAAMRILVVRSGDQLPDSETLASQYDLVLMAHSRFAAEDKYKPADASLSSIPRQCRCSIPDGGNKVLCRCAKPHGPSPLLGLRWKRLVVDEGQVASGRTTMLVGLARALSVERIWVVSGTPTPNLVSRANPYPGPSASVPPPPNEPMSSSSTSMSPKILDNLSIFSPKKKRRKLTLPGRERSPPSPVLDPSEFAWPQYLEEDVKRLGLIFSSFIRFGAFHQEGSSASDMKAAEKAWKQEVVAPLRIGTGIQPQVGAVARLDTLMKTFMVRHREGDLKVLPPLTHTTRVLELEPAARLTYNALQSIIVVNNVATAREGVDWLFHPSNSEHLAQVLLNITYSCFWHTTGPDPSHHPINLEPSPSSPSLTKVKPPLKRKPVSVVAQVAEALENAKKDYSRGKPDAEKEDDYSVEDMALLQEAIRRLEEALSEERWLALQGGAFGLSLPFPLSGLPEGQTGLEAGGERFFTPAEVQEKRKRWAKDGDLGKGVVVGKTQSTKLNFVLSEVLAHPGDKFILFSMDVVALTRILEALDAIGVTCVYVSSQVKDRKKRDHLLTRFKEEAIVQVLLMELKFGARGLDLPQASRIIFTEPCWSRDIELQALKRAHRQGQLKPVVAYTLIASGTNEEQQYNLLRSTKSAAKGAKISGAAQTQTLMKDPRMRDLLQHPRFVDELSEGMEGGGRVELEIELMARRGLIAVGGAEEEAEERRGMKLEVDEKDERKPTQACFGGGAGVVRFA